MTNSGAAPALEKLMQFAARRHEILANNIANLSTPGFRPADVSVHSFQEQLGEAIDRKRAGNAMGWQALAAFPGALAPHAHSQRVDELRLSDSNEVIEQDGRLKLNPEPAEEGMLFHDGSDRDLERAMQDMVENFMAFRTASQFLRREFETLKLAIRERM